MKKAIFPIFILIIVFIAACQQAVQKDAMEKAAETPKTAAGDAAVDAVGSDISNVESVEDDLSADGLGDLDSGLTDVQNIWERL